MAEETQEPSRLSRIVEMKIRLEWLIVIGAAFGWTSIQQYFAVQTLITSVSDLQITVKTGNVSSSVLQGEVSLLKFRISNIEAEQMRINDALKQLTVRTK